MKLECTLRSVDHKIMTCHSQGTGRVSLLFMFCGGVSNRLNELLAKVGTLIRFIFSVCSVVVLKTNILKE